MQYNTNYPNNNLLEIWVNTFEACMDACSAYHATDVNPNSTACDRVSYQAGAGGGLEGESNVNCHLKSKNNEGRGTAQGVDSALTALNSAKGKRDGLWILWEARKAVKLG